MCTLLLAIVLFICSLTGSQPSTLKQTWKTANEHCTSRNASLASLNNSNNSGPLLTDLLIRRIRSSVDGKYTSWIAYKGCFDVLVIPYGTIKNKNITIPDNTVEKCYLECQRENIKCKPTEPVYFALKASLCLCVCSIQELLSHSNKCNESCFADNDTYADDCFSVYKDHNLEDTEPAGFCLLCSEANLNSDVKFSAFGCDPIGLCAEREDKCYVPKGDSGKLDYSKLNCSQQLPLVCLNDNGAEKQHGHENTYVIIVGVSAMIISTSVVIFILLYLRKILRRPNVHAELQREHSRYDNFKIHFEKLTPGQTTSNDSNLQKVYHIIVPTTGNNVSPEANHHYDHIHKSKQEDENHYEKVL